METPSTISFDTFLLCVFYPAKCPVFFAKSNHPRQHNFTSKKFSPLNNNKTLLGDRMDIFDIKLEKQMHYNHRQKQDLVLSVKLQLKYNLRFSLVQKSLVQKECGLQKLRSPKIVSKYLVKIGSVTVEILLICTNVPRTYVALSNVTITVGIC